MMRHSCFLFFILALTVFLVPLSVRPLVDPDEARYGEIAREMAESGDWVVPRLNGVRYFEKPVMGYWMFAGSMKVFGINAFALRLPAVLSLLFTGSFLCFLMRRSGAGPRESMTGAEIFLTMPLVILLFTLGILDGMFTLFITLCCGTFYLALEKTSGRGGKIFLYLLCGVFAGAAFLVKGFLGFAIPAVTACAYLVWTRRWKGLFLLPWLPLMSALLVIAPWAVLIHRAEPDFWHYFIVVEHWQRFFGGEKAQHAQHFLYFVPILLGGAALWIPFAPAAAVGLRRRFHADPLVRFSFCWFVFPFLLLSCSSGKLGTYILPCFAPLSILFAAGLEEWPATGKLRALPDWIFRILIAALCLGCLLVPVNTLTGFPVRLFSAPEYRKILILLVCAALMAMLLLAGLKRKSLRGKLRIYAFSILPVVAVSHCLMPDSMAEMRSPVVVLKTLPPVPAETALVSFRYPFQSVCWFYGRNDVWMLSPGEIQYGLKYPDAEHRLIDWNGLTKLIESKRGNGGVALIMAADRLRDAYESGRFQIPASRSFAGTNDDGISVLFFDVPPDAGER